MNNAFIIRMYRLVLFLLLCSGGKTFREVIFNKTKSVYPEMVLIIQNN